MRELIGWLARGHFYSSFDGVATVPPLFSAVSRRRCILSSPPVSDGQTTYYTSRRPLRAFPRERATQAALSAGADRRKALPRSSVRPSRFPWPRKSPRAWKCSRQCDDRAEGRRRECANDERTNERGERPSWKPGADERTSFRSPHGLGRLKRNRP